MDAEASGVFGGEQLHGNSVFPAYGSPKGKSFNETTLLDVTILPSRLGELPKLIVAVLLLVLASYPDILSRLRQDALTTPTVEEAHMLVNLDSADRECFLSRIIRRMMTRTRVLVEEKGVGKCLRCGQWARLVRCVSTDDDESTETRLDCANLEAYLKQRDYLETSLFCWHCGRGVFM